MQSLKKRHQCRDREGTSGFMHQFFVDDDQIGREYVTITGSDVHHIRDVLKMREGEKIRVSSRLGENFYCRIAEIGECFVQADITDDRAESTELSRRISLFQALPKGERMEYIIEKAVELGVYEIIPVEMKYCVMRLNEKKKAARLPRWQAISEAAAKQSKRSLVPGICPVMGFEEAVERAKKSDLFILPYENESSMEGTRQIFEDLKYAESVSLMIGPEGGFSAEEIETAGKYARRVSLGRRILRTDTAAICALSALMLAFDGLLDTR